MESFAAGIIPYTVLNNETFFLLGLERSNHKWSGFVGGSEPSETPILTALREFHEETSLAFHHQGNYFYNEVLKTQPILEKTQTGKIVYLWFIECPPESMSMNLSVFYTNQNEISDRHYKEKSELRWIPLSQIPNEKVLYRLKQTILKHF